MGIAYNTSIVRDGLVLHLDAANVKSYPGSGTTWYDLSGNGNHGTLTNGPSYISGDMQFDGVNDWINFGNVDIITSTFSVEAWFKGNTTQTGTYNSIVTKDISGSFGTFAMTSNSSNNYIRFGYSGSNGQKEVNASGTAGATDLKLNEWVHYCGTWDGANVLSLYRNGALISTSTGANGTLVTGNSSNLMVGDRTATDGFFAGSIPVVRLYNNKCLSDSEVKQNFEALRGRYGI